MTLAVEFFENRITIKPQNNNHVFLTQPPCRYALYTAKRQLYLLRSNRNYDCFFLKTI